MGRIVAAERDEAASGESGAGGGWRGERVRRGVGSVGAKQAWRCFAASTEGPGEERRRMKRHVAMVNLGEGRIEECNFRYR